ncbi:Eukaryotic translation initiation factor 5A [Halotydeus destructor]|nr:Eukaryotic translation initiation factor 5A [Halotydeus destructor]
MSLRIAFTLSLALNFVSVSHGQTPGTKRVMAEDLSEDDHIMLQGHPCKIEDIEVAPQQMITFTGRDVFTNERYAETYFAANYVQVPEVTRKEYTVISISSGNLTLEDKDGAERSITVPEGDIRTNIRIHLDHGHYPVVTVVSALGMEKVVAYRYGSPVA